MKTNFGKNKVFPEQKSYVKKGGFFQTDKKNKRPFRKGPEDKTEDGNVQKTFKKDSFFLKDNSSNKKFFNKEKKHEKPVTEDITKDKSEKKPFDKKAYRLKKYSLKYKVDKYEENRKKEVLRNYYKDFKKGEPTGGKYIAKGFDDALGTDSEEELNKNEEETPRLQLKDSRKEISPKKENPRKNIIKEEIKTEEIEDKKLNSAQKRGKAFKAANKELTRLKEAKQAKKEEILKKKSEKEEAINNYKKKKAEKYKKLSKKTKRGQPIMKDRMEMLLEEIQKST